MKNPFKMFIRWLCSFKPSPLPHGDLRDLLMQQHEQIIQLQSDMFYRMMRQYIFDTYIHLYTLLAHEFHEDGKKETDNFLAIIKEEMTTIGVSFETSKRNTPFNPQIMEVSKYPSILTDKREQNNGVAVTIVPQMKWNVSSGKETLTVPLKKEEVILFSFSGNTNAEDIPQQPERELPSTLPSETVIPLDDNPRVINPTGFLIQCRGDSINDITCLYTILPGKNEVGTTVKNLPNDLGTTNVCRLLLPKKNNEPFAVIINNEEDCFQANVTQGKWGINSKDNHQDQYSLCNRDIIYINNVKFIFIVA